MTTFQDEFDSPLAVSDWLISDYALPGGWINTAWSPSNVSVAAGQLTLTLDDQPLDGKTYSGGEIRSVEDFSFGTYTVTMQTASGGGANSTFFLYSPQTEIDFEFLSSDPTKALVTYHFEGESSGVVVDLGFDSSAGMNTYTIEWGPDSIAWYANGVLLYSVTDPTDLEVPTADAQIFMNIWHGTPSWMGDPAFAPSTSATYESVSFTARTAPVAQDDWVILAASGPVILDLLANDNDPDGPALEDSDIVITQAPTFGALSQDPGTGELTYSPYDANFVGVERFEYSVSDINGEVSNTAWVTVQVGLDPIDPEAVQLTDAADDNLALITDGADVFDGLAGDDTLYGGDGTDRLYGNIGNDVLNGNSSADQLYGGSGDDVLDGGKNNDLLDGGAGADTLTGGKGNDTFKFSVVDGAVDTVEDYAWWNFLDVGDALIGYTAGVDTLSDFVRFTASGADTLLEINPDGASGFVPVALLKNTAGLVGQESALEANGRLLTAGTNAAPEAMDDAASVDEDQSVAIDVLANDSDPDGGVLSLLSAGQGQFGSVVIDAGQLIYTPDADANGTDSFSYTVSDGQGGEAVATVTVTVTPTPDAPVAQDDTASGEQDGPIQIDVLSNDSDADGDALTIDVSGSTPSNGQVAVANGQIVYTPDAGFVGDDSFDYAVSDGSSGATATVTVTVYETNAAPVAGADVATTPEDQAVAIDLLANDTDANGDPLTVSAVTSAFDDPATAGVVETEHGSVTLSNGVATYTPDADFAGPDGFGYEVTDGKESSSGTVSVTVQAVNDAPVAQDDTAVTDPDVAVSIDVLANDSDVDGDGLTIDISGSAPGNGSVSVVNGEILYTPDAGFIGSDSFDYAVSDGTESRTATVAVTVGSIYDPIDPEAVQLTDAADDNLALITDGADVFDGLAGDDTLYGGGGTDRLYGNIGNDVLNGNSSADQLYGGSGDDVLDGGKNNDLLDGGAGADTLTGGKGNDTFKFSVVDGAVDTVEDYAWWNFLDVGDALIGYTAGVDTLSDFVRFTASGADTLLEINPDGASGFVPVALLKNTAGLVGQESALEANGRLLTAGTNAAPEAMDDAASVDEDQSVAIDVLANDSDPDGGVLSLLSAGQGQFGSVVIDAGQLIYTPDADANGTDSFSYTVSDGQGGEAVATVTVTVTPTPDAPVAQDDTASGEQDGPIQIDVLSNDSDADGDALTIDVSGSTPSNGQVAVANGQIVYTPDAGFVGDDSFDYAVSDGSSGATATVTVTVYETNAAPVAGADVATTPEDQAVAIDLLANDTDANGDPLTVSAVTSAFDDPATAGVVETEHGSVTLSNGVATYTPDADFAGPDGFGYEVTDGKESSSGTVSVTVQAVNDAPVAQDDTAVTDPDVAVSIDVLANDSDVDGDGLTIDISGSAPGNGSVSVVNGEILYTPDAGFIGSDSFDYAVSDGTESRTATVAVTVGSIYDPIDPEAVQLTDAADDNLALITDGADVFDGLAGDDTLYGGGGTDRLYGNIGNDVLNGNSSADQLYGGSGDDVLDGGKNNDLLDGGAGADTLTGGKGNDTFKFSVVDGAVDTVEDYAWWNFLDVGDALIGYTAGVDTLSDFVRFTASGADTLLEINPDGASGFVPVALLKNTAGLVGQESALEANGRLLTAGTNAAPEAMDDAASVDEDQSVAIDVLANDSDPDGGVLSLLSAGQGQFGSVVIDAGQLIYTPDADANGTDSFSYTVSDGQGGEAVATVTVTVTPTPDAPVAQDDTASGEQDGPIQIDVLSNDSDADGDALTIDVSGSAPSNGQVAVANGQIVYTPDAGFVGDDSFDYAVSDGSSGATATVTVTVYETNAAPVAGADVATTPEDQAVAIDLLANDTDANGDPLTVSAVTSAFDDPATAGVVETEHGSVTLSNGVATYTPDADFAGPDGFGYEVTDGKESSSGTVSVTVQAVNDAPVAQDDTAVTDPDVAVSIDVLANDSDVDGDGLTIDISGSAPGNGSVSVVNGEILYTPDAGFIGSDSFDYAVSDGTESRTATVTVTVGSIYDPIDPEAVQLTDAADDNLALITDGADVFDGLAGDDTLYGGGGTDRLYGNIGNDVLNGNSSADQLYGGSGDDILDGGKNNDLLDGGAGADTLTGGKGNDTFKFSVVDGAVDTVEDYAWWNFLDVGDALIGYTAGVDTLSDFVRFTASGADTLLEINPDGASGFVPVALLKNTAGLVGQESALEANGRLITIDPPPVANDDFVSVDSSGSWTIDVLNNDVDPDADYLTTLEVSGISGQPSNGSVALVNGEVIYTPNAGYVGADSFDYTITDEKSTDTATVFLSVGQRDFSGETRSLTVDVSQGTYAFAATVMTFGDSLTQGDKNGDPNDEGGFRDDVFENLSADNIWIDHVGRFNSGPEGMLDKDHSGLPGHSLAEVLTDDPNDLMNFSLTVDELNPDVTWFMMGTNDMNGPSKVDQIIAGIQVVIDQFYALDGAQDRHLVISLIPVKPAFADLVDATNEGYSTVNGEIVAGDAGNGTFVPGIRQIVEAASAVHTTLHLFEPPITENELLPDQLHFTDAGDALYAQAMADLLETEIGFSAGTIDGSGISFDAINVIGGDAGDLLIGDAQANLLNGGAGNDVVRGSGGDDMLLGGLGTDRLYGGAGADTLTGGEGNDSFIFGSDFALNAASADVIVDFGDLGSDRLVFEQSLGPATVADQTDGSGVTITINGSDIEVDGADAGLLKGTALGGGIYEITADNSLVLFVQDPDILLV